MLKGSYHSEATKSKISKNHKGKKRSEEIKRKISKTMKGTRKGKENPNYKSGNYTIEKLKDIHAAYQSYDYRLWRKLVFERDNYTCQVCRKVGGHLTVHHIKSWAKYPKLRYVVDNGATLCEGCHSLTDNYKSRARQYV